MCRSFVLKMTFPMVDVNLKSEININILVYLRPEFVRTSFTGRIQCEVLTTLPFCFSWIKKFLGQQSKL